MDELSEQEATLRLLPPDFPLAQSTPAVGAPGDTIIVEATGLIPDQLAKIFIGDEMVGTGMIDGEGNILTEFLVPDGTPLGRRLLTVGVMGTAVTADSFLDVVPEPPTYLLVILSVVPALRRGRLQRPVLHGV